MQRYPQGYGIELLRTKAPRPHETYQHLIYQGHIKKRFEEKLTVQDSQVFTNYLLQTYGHVPDWSNSFRLAQKTLTGAANAMARYDLKPHSLDPRLLGVAAEWLHNIYHPTMCNSKPLSLETILNTQDDDKSPGLPWSHDIPTKGEFFQSTTGEFFYKYWDALGTTQPIWSLAGLAHKTELISKEKFDADRPRSVCAMDACHVTSHGILCHDMDDKLKSNPLETPSALGLNPFHRGWDKAYRKLGRFKRAAAIDGSRFDAKFYWAVFFIIVKFRFSCLAPMYQTALNWLRLLNLYVMMCFAYVVNVGGDVWLKFVGSPSGQKCTTTDNILKSTIDWIMIWLICTPTSYHTWEKFREHCELLIMGDDIVVSVSDEVAPYLTAADIKRAGDIIGMQYTFETEEMATVEDLTFCSMGFIKRTWGHHSAVLPLHNCDRSMCSILHACANPAPSVQIGRLCQIYMMAWTCDKCRPFLQGYASYLRKLWPINTTPGAAEAWKAWKSDSDLAKLFFGLESAPAPAHTAVRQSAVPCGNRSGTTVSTPPPHNMPGGKKKHQATSSKKKKAHFEKPRSHKKGGTSSKKKYTGSGGKQRNSGYRTGTSEVVSQYIKSNDRATPVEATKELVRTSMAHEKREVTIAYGMARKVLAHIVRPWTSPIPKLGYGDTPTQVFRVTADMNLPVARNTDTSCSFWTALFPTNGNNNVVPSRAPILFQGNGMSTLGAALGSTYFGAVWNQKDYVSASYSGYRVVSLGIQLSLSKPDTVPNPLVSAGTINPPPSVSSVTNMNIISLYGSNGLPSSASKDAMALTVTSRPHTAKALEMSLQANKDTSVGFQGDWSIPVIALSWPAGAIAAGSPMPYVYVRYVMGIEGYVSTDVQTTSFEDQDGANEGALLDVPEVFDALSSMPAFGKNQIVYGLSQIGAIAGSTLASMSVGHKGAEDVAPAPGSSQDGEGGISSNEMALRNQRETDANKAKLNKLISLLRDDEQVEPFLRSLGNDEYKEQKPPKVPAAAQSPREYAAASSLPTVYGDDAIAARFNTDDVGGFDSDWEKKALAMLAMRQQALSKPQ
jgi:hypothetical protein